VSNISKLLVQTEKNVQDGATAFVFDILGNTSVRFEQFDGSSALPYKSGGRFHLGGKTVVSSSDIFSKTTNAILPVLRAAKGKPCVIIPPLPRYLFARCCDDAGHCTNFDQSDFAQNLLSGFIQLRNLLIRTLVQKGLKNFKVLDTCCVTSCKTTANIAERLSEMKKVTAKDGIHFVATGYGKSAARATTSLVAMMAAPRSEETKSTHFWRGFKSFHVSREPKISLPGPTKSRGRGYPSGSRFTRGFHPYRRN
jgi:lysophospholipase L1-like esterase